jgi:hypothetical protein
MPLAASHQREVLAPRLPDRLREQPHCRHIRNTTLGMAECVGRETGLAEYR